MASVPEAREQKPVRRYVNAAVAIHWITALLIVIQVWLGFTFADLPRGPERMEFFTWHKTVGATILLLAIARLIVRLRNPPPPFPPELPAWERHAAVWNHRAFYFLLFALPLTGLVAVSGRAEDWYTPLVGGIPLPVVPGIDEATGELSGGVHEVLVFTTLALLVLHVGAAVKQQFFDSTRQVAGRMPPFRPKSGEPTRPADEQAPREA
ncbi:cytochrome b [Sphingomonas sp. GCM10030256]|uniref:cytochrome b n=1 Tax=Sphingomonas sp. GCM10030256 TaxID=3273427 RepID=UPI00361B90E0